MAPPWPENPILDNDNKARPRHSKQLRVFPECRASSLASLNRPARRSYLVPLLLIQGTRSPQQQIRAIRLLARRSPAAGIDGELLE